MFGVAFATLANVQKRNRGDSSCRTPDAVSSIEKAWDRSLGRGFPSPSAHERSMGSMRTRC